MGTEKLEDQLEEVKIKQTRRKLDPIRFKEEAINKVNEISPILSYTRTITRTFRDKSSFWCEYV